MRITATEIPSDWTQQIEEIARTTGRTSGAVIREAIAHYLGKTDSLTGQFVNVNIVTSKQLIASLCPELHNPVNFIHKNLTRASEYAQQLQQLLHLYARYYSPPLLEIQQYAEEIDVEFLLEDFPKLLSCLKLGANRIDQICQFVYDSSHVDEAQAELREAIAQYLGKADLFTNRLVQDETPRLGQLIAGVCNELNSPVCFMYGNLNYTSEYVQNLLQLLHLYAKYYSPPVPEIQQYAEAINLKFLVEDLLNVRHLQNINSRLKAGG